MTISVGARFGRWLVTGDRVTVPNGVKNRCGAWVCTCDCGAVAVVRETKLKRGDSKSCGCLVPEVARRTRLTSPRQPVHGLSHTPTYRSWYAMKQRCSNPRNLRWADYGGRGIKVCDRWQTFSNFLADMGIRPEGMTLDRMNVNGDYEVANCRWATHQEQRRNRRDAR